MGVERHGAVSAKVPCPDPRRRLAVAARVRDQSEHVHGGAVGRINGQDAAVCGLGVAQPAIAVVGGGRLQQRAGLDASVSHQSATRPQKVQTAVPCLCGLRPA